MRIVAARFLLRILTLVLVSMVEVRALHAQTSAPNLAPDPASTRAPVTVAPVVITATRIASDPMNLPMAISVVEADGISEAQLQVNLSESLQRVPGVNAQNRNNYAQDVQLSVRGFGARSSFGVRGIKLYTDGIPASQPDGQGQVSHFSLGSADRIEMLRGPFSALYGNAAGGVIQVFTESGVSPTTVTTTVAAGSNDTLRVGIKANGREGAVGYVAQVDRFDTDGPRPQSAATRFGANAKLDVKVSEATTVTVIGNHVNLPGAQDPLGLTRSEFNANARQVNPLALQFNTRKDLEQTQGGARVRHTLNATQALEFVAYTGERAVRQFQAIPVATQAPATYPGGVIDFDRNYYGVDARFVQSGAWGNVALGVTSDVLNENRRGYQNFVGTALGVLGALRRDEKNKLNSTDGYMQGEWRMLPWLPEASIHAGIRASSVKLVSADKYIVAGNGDDSGSVRYSALLPSVGVNWRVMPALSLYASAGRGIETPTLNELAYRPPGSVPATGLNLSLLPARSDSVEIGAKWRRDGVSAELALFDTKTKDEIVVISNSGGRSAFANAGRTHRRGIELSTRAQLDEWVAGLQWELAANTLDARYRDGFKTCGAPPCTVPSVLVAAGNRLPGVPNRAAWTELKWTHASGVYVAAEVKHQGRIIANDIGDESVNAVTLVGARIGVQQQWGKASLRAFLRGDNLSGKTYAGAVIVNEANRRYFEPAAGRTWLAGVSLSLGW